MKNEMNFSPRYSYFWKIVALEYTFAFYEETAKVDRGKKK